jgi:FtsP/CotA-like multicopper oxidase with cupredoxin domain
MRMKLSAMFFLLAAALVALPAYAQTPNCTPGRDLITIPEIKSDNTTHRLQGTIILSDEQRSFWGSATGTPCNLQRFRYFKGFSASDPTKPWPETGDPIPGPTLRARVGDLVELTFLNQVNTKNFPNTLDQGEEGKGTPEGCDISTATRTQGGTAQIYPRNDNYPNCLHGSSTANLHFHGTHTTPSTTGDNVLLFIHPALRDTGTLEPSDGFVNQQFASIFSACEKNGSPTKWDQMPVDWQNRQKDLLNHYDTTAPYKGVPGALPQNMKLWPQNEANLAAGRWPQYSIGATPYCFRLPALLLGGKKYEMYQAPGTHWYHAHKHGSTALNVGNGMTGAFIIEGEYDDTLRHFYRATPQHKNWGLTEQVLVIQQLETALNLLSPTNKGGPPPLSVNGRLNPIIHMKPNQVQMWRIVNGAARDFVQFYGFTQHGQGGLSVAWRQIAQDGVQFAFDNYQGLGAINNKFNLATANRADLLVRAPNKEGDYALQVITSVSDLPTGTPITLLTVRVAAQGGAIDPPMDFIQNRNDFPKLPPFLGDITGPFYKTRNLYFNTSPSSARKGKGSMPLHTINDKLFDGHHVDQTMTLNTVEEWTLYNQTINIAHPFHIHINPFQITAVFQPNSKEASDPGNKNCYADPLKPDTWKPCFKIPQPYVWWDVFTIPTARQDKLPAAVCTELDKCPADIQPYTACTGGTCTVTIAGYFTMRSRFADFTGQYVIHCHILAHEDRGMMELIEVAAQAESGYIHH